MKFDCPLLIWFSEPMEMKEEGKGKRERERGGRGRRRGERGGEGGGGREREGEGGGGKGCRRVRKIEKAEGEDC